MPPFVTDRTNKVWSMIERVRARLITGGSELTTADIKDGLPVDHIACVHQ
jgi:hypothetical protein